ncbi:MAG: YfiT family bacillithiol transferase [Gemmatimonadaceae bacterium]
MPNVHDLRYPIGRFERPATLSAEARGQCIEHVSATPGSLWAAVEGLSAEQLDTPYRPGGWTVRQLIHHMPDSHLNAYTRFKLALTEHEPTIKPYEEARWAELPDSRETPTETSLALLDALHERWGILLRHMTEADFARRLRHPESGLQSLDQLLALYAWHGRHHVAHVKGLRDREGW